MIIKFSKYVLDWHPGPVKVGQTFKNTPLCNLPPRDPQTKIKKICFIVTGRLAESVEGLNSSLSKRLASYGVANLGKEFFGGVESVLRDLPWFYLFLYIQTEFFCLWIKWMPLRVKIPTTLQHYTCLPAMLQGCHWEFNEIPSRFTYEKMQGYKNPKISKAIALFISEYFLSVLLLR